MALEARTLNRRLRIERLATTVDPLYNSDVPGGWVTHVAKVWGSVVDEPVEAVNAEVIHTSQREIVRKATVTIRWRAGLTNEMRFVEIERNRVLHIVNQAELGRRDGIAFACEEYASR